MREGKEEKWFDSRDCQCINCKLSRMEAILEKLSEQIEALSGAPPSPPKVRGRA
jgi:hypothetical protein